MSIVWLPIDLVRWASRKYVLTNRRVMRMDGVLRKRSFDSSLEQINDIRTEQSFLGRTLGYADLTIYTASDTANEVYAQLLDGLQFKKAVLEAKEAIRTGTLLTALPEGFIVKGGTNEASMRADGKIKEPAAAARRRPRLQPRLGLLPRPLGCSRGCCRRRGQHGDRAQWRDARPPSRSRRWPWQSRWPWRSLAAACAEPVAVARGREPVAGARRWSSSRSREAVDPRLRAGARAGGRPEPEPRGSKPSTPGPTRSRPRLDRTCRTRACPTGEAKRRPGPGHPKTRTRRRSVRSLSGLACGTHDRGEARTSFRHVVRRRGWVVRTVVWTPGWDVRHEVRSLQRGGFRAADSGPGRGLAGRDRVPNCGGSLDYLICGSVGGGVVGSEARARSAGSRARQSAVAVMAS